MNTILSAFPVTKATAARSPGKKITKATSAASAALRSPKPTIQSITGSFFNKLGSSIHPRGIVSSSASSSANKVEDLATPILDLISPDPNGFPNSGAGGPVIPSILLTPPRQSPRKRKIEVSPSIVPSPTVPKPPADTHYADKLPTLPNKKIKFSGKEAHTVVPPNSVEQKARAISRLHGRISRQRQHILKYPQDKGKLSPIKDGNTLVRVGADHVEVDGRIFKFHEGVDPKGIKYSSAYPVPQDGDDLILFKKGTALSPSKLETMVKSAKLTADPKKALIAALNKLASPPSSTGASSSSSHS